MSNESDFERPVAAGLHPIENGNYRIPTPAIETFHDLIMRCLRYRIPGALIYGPSRIGKTRAIEYLRLLLAETQPKITTYHTQAEHKPRHAEGPFFANLLEAVGYPDPDRGANATKRLRLINKIKEACSRNGAGTVILFCDEAQRYDERANMNGCATCMITWIGCRFGSTPYSSASRNCYRSRPVSRRRARHKSWRA